MSVETTEPAATTGRTFDRSPRVAVIVASVHHGNTRRIAEVIADAMNADILFAPDVSVENLAKYDCVAFGSGIYFGRHHESIRKLAKSVEDIPQTVIVFSTAGLPWLSRWFHGPLRRTLQKRGCNLIGEFSCRGWDTVGPLFLMGGINRNHPNKSDLEHARSFAIRMADQLAVDV